MLEALQTRLQQDLGKGGEARHQELKAMIEEDLFAYEEVRYLFILWTDTRISTPSTSLRAIVLKWQLTTCRCRRRAGFFKCGGAGVCTICEQGAGTSP